MTTATRTKSNKRDKIVHWAANRVLRFATPEYQAALRATLEAGKLVFADDELADLALKKFQERLDSAGTA